MLVIVIILIIFAEIFSRLYYHRSLIATIVEKIIKTFGNALSKDYEKSEAYIEDKLTSDEETYILPNTV